VSFNIILSVFSLLFSLDDLWMQAFLYGSSAMNLHSVAVLCDIIYTNVHYIFRIVFCSL